jgi:cation transport protein ChaC
VAHRIEAARVEDETSVLWMREMLSGAYTPVWVRCEDGADGFDAITFVINRAHPRFAPPGTLAEQAAVIARAAGASGANRDYLYRCTQDLRARGVADPYVEALFSAVTAITGEPGDPLPFGGKIP